MGSETYKIEKREKKDRNKVVENEKLDKIQEIAQKDNYENKENY